MIGLPHMTACQLHSLPFCPPIHLLAGTLPDYIPLPPTSPSPPVDPFHIPTMIPLPPVRTTPPPRHYWKCPEVPPPETEQHIESLMYEWMRTHSIALRHWTAMENPHTAPLTVQQHHQEWEQYSTIAGYCQHRIFTASGWPLPSPGLGFPAFRNLGLGMTGADLVYSPLQIWNTPHFWDPHASAHQGCHPPPAE